MTLWLRERYLAYLNSLCELLASDEPGLRIPALDILTDLVRVESARLTDLAKKHCFVGNLYGKIVAALISAESFSEPLKKELMEKYLDVYDDLRFYFFKDVMYVPLFSLELRALSWRIEEETHPLMMSLAS